MVKKSPSKEFLAKYRWFTKVMDVILRRLALHWYRRTRRNAIIRFSFATMTWHASCASGGTATWILGKSKLERTYVSDQSKVGAKSARKNGWNEEVSVERRICRLPVCFLDNYETAEVALSRSSNRAQLRFSQKSRLWLLVPSSTSLRPMYTAAKYVIAACEIKQAGIWRNGVMMLGNLVIVTLMASCTRKRDIIAETG